MPKMIGLINDDKSLINKKILESELNNKVPITRKVNGQSLDKDIEIVGARGTGILKITTAPSSYTTAIGEYTPKYRIALSTVTSQSGVSEVLLGDVIQYSYYQYHISYLDSTYAYISATRTSLRGATGPTGETGPKGDTGDPGPKPVKGVDYFTAADQEAIVQQVIAALGTPVFGRVDADNNIILTGELAEGKYTLKYEDAEGKQTVIGDLTLAKSGEILIVWEPGYTIDGNTGEVSWTGFNWGDGGVVHVGGPIELVSGRTYRLTTNDARYCNMYAYYYTASDTYISRQQLWDARSATAAAPYNVAMTLPTNAGIVRFRSTAGTRADGTSDLDIKIKPVLVWEAV